MAKKKSKPTKHQIKTPERKPVASAHYKAATKPITTSKFLKGFRNLGRVKESHNQPIYCVVLSDNVNVTESNGATKVCCYMATCGAQQVSIYEMEIQYNNTSRRSEFVLMQSYMDEDKKESYFSCVFGGRCRYNYKLDKPLNAVQPTPPGFKGSSSSGGHKRSRNTNNDSSLQNNGNNNTDNNNVDNKEDPDTSPPLLCVAGERGVIKLIDTVQQCLWTQLSGHGGEVYDLKVSPCNDSLLLSASQDESVRLWNLQSLACVAIFAGHHGHRESVLCTAWHPLGQKIVTSGQDRFIRLWDLSKGRVHESILASQRTNSTGERRCFQARLEQFPYFATNKVHVNYVDSVDFVGNMMVSKSVEDRILLWTPLIPESDGSIAAVAYCPPSSVVVLRTFSLRNCDIWFLRFGINRAGKLLAVGNTQGEVSVWDIDSAREMPIAKLKPSHSACTVRMVAFSSDGKILVSCHDNASVNCWEAMY